jgi:hypothetical protein
MAVERVCNNIKRENKFPQTYQPTVADKALERTSRVRNHGILVLFSPIVLGNLYHQFKLNNTIPFSRHASYPRGLLKDCFFLG